MDSNLDLRICACNHSKGTHKGWDFSGRCLVPDCSCDSYEEVVVASIDNEYGKINNASIGCEVTEFGTAWGTLSFGFRRMYEHFTVLATEIGSLVKRTKALEDGKPNAVIQEYSQEMTDRITKLESNWSTVSYGVLSIVGLEEKINNYKNKQEDENKFLRGLIDELNNKFSKRINYMERNIKALKHHHHDLPIEDTSGFKQTSQPMFTEVVYRENDERLKCNHEAANTIKELKGGTKFSVTYCRKCGAMQVLWDHKNPEWIDLPRD